MTVIYKLEWLDAKAVVLTSCKVLVRPMLDEFYLHMNQASIANPGFYLHIQFKFFA